MIKVRLQIESKNESSGSKVLRNSLRLVEHCRDLFNKLPSLELRLPYLGTERS